LWFLGEGFEEEIFWTGLTRHFVFATEGTENTESLVSFAYSASSATKVNFVTEACFRPQAAWPPQLRFELTKFVSRESYLVSGGLRRRFDIWLKEFVGLG